MTVTEASTPLVVSRADTASSPSASTWKVTRMRALPAAIGGMPRSSKRASERQSSTSSRSPCTTWIAIAVWPSLKVVNSCARATGMVELRGMIFSTRPPIVSRPSDSGITSSSSQSSPVARLPTSTLACIAAPTETTWSGSMSVSGSRPKSSATALRTFGMRVAPPTSTTPSTSAAFSPASASALREAASVLATRCCVMPAKVSAPMVRFTHCPVDSRACSVAVGLLLSVSLAARAFTVSSRWSDGGSSDRLACSSAQQYRRWSKSSPPSAESPPVASTSKTPLVNFRIEMSKVPPPRS